MNLTTVNADPPARPRADERCHPAANPTAPRGVVLARMSVPSDISLTRKVREFVADLAAETAAPAHVVDDTVLLASELHANALRHAPGSVITVQCLHDRVRSTFTVRIEDQGGALQSRRAGGTPNPGDLDASGRGLTLVDAIAAEWGWYTVPSGKAVWFTMDLNAPNPTPHDTNDTRHPT